MKLRMYIIFLFAGFCSFSQGNEANKLKFIKNNGQITDFNSQPREDVLFLSNINGMNLFIRNNGISYLMGNYDVVNSEIEERVEKFKEKESDVSKIDQFKIDLRNKIEYSFHQIDVDFLNSNENTSVVSNSKCYDYINYYNVTNSDGITNVPLFNSITHQNIYDGIDVKFYGNKNGFEYDFIISPKSDVNQIKLLWKGSEGIKIMKDGRLKIETSLHDIIESIPEAYQIIDGNKIQIKVSYNLTRIPDSKNAIINFNIDQEYDTNHKLIIDPWVTYYGGTGYDRGNDLFNDSFGNLYVVGSTNSSNAIATPGSFKATFTSATGFSHDGFITKFSPTGTRIWASYYGGNDMDVFQSVTVDKNDFVYVVGYTSSTTGIATMAIHKDTLTPRPTSTTFARDAFLVKFSPAGTRLWGTYYGGEQNELGYEVASDTSGDVYIVGNTLSTTGISTPGAFKTTLTTTPSSTFGSDVFLAKFNTAGNLLWGTYYGGDKYELGYGLAVDDNNNVFICGYSQSLTGIATTGTHQSTLSGTSNDAFLVKFRANGTRVWGTYFGGTSSDIGNSLAIDTNNNIYMSGRTNSTASISTAGSFQAINGGGLDAFLAKFNQSGNRIWATFYGGNRSDYSYAVAVNKNTNNAMMSGDTYSSNLPVSPCALQTRLRGLENGFIGQFYPDGSIYCSSYFGNNHEEDTKITTFDCYIYLTGYSPSGVSTTPGAHQTVSGGSTEAWIGQLFTNTCGVSTPIKSLPVSTVNNTNVCKPCNGSATVIVNSSCLEDSLYTYTWSNGTIISNSTDTFNTVLNLCADNYWVEVMIQNACIITRDTVYFTISDTLLPVIDFTLDSVCFGFSTSFTNTSINEPAGTSYLWDFGDGNASTLNNPSHVYSSPGTYSVTYIHQYGPGCFDTIIKTTTVYPKPKADFSITLEGIEYFSDNLDSLCAYLYETIEFKDYSTVQVPGLINDYLWSFSTERTSVNQNPSYAFQGIKSHPISLVVTSDKGCKDTANSIIKVCDDFNFSIPNSFTPNEDGINDLFIHNGFGIDTEKYLFQIFNRWGELIYETTKLDGWDGTHNGVKVPEGVYVWKVQYKRINGNEITEKTGHVTLTRKGVD